MILKISLLMISCALLLLTSSCVKILNEQIVSPGRVQSLDSLKLHNLAFAKVSETLSIDPPKTYEIIGHGASSWRYYPMGINRAGIVYGNGLKYKKTQADSIIDLIDKSIAIDPTMSIELDAHYPPDWHPLRIDYPTDGAIILHDIPNWNKERTESKKAIDYFHNNTLKKAVDHFVAKDYFQKSKLYVEIKTTKDCYDGRKQNDFCQSSCRKLAVELKGYARDVVRPSGENWLCVSSFSPLALSTFRNSLPEDIRDHIDYVLIVGYTGSFIKAMLAQSKGYVPRYDKAIDSFLVNTQWVDVVWFSGQGIKDFNTALNKLRADRIIAHPDWEELEFSFSTYQKKLPKMVKLMTKEPHLKVKIRSFMLDLDF